MSKWIAEFELEDGDSMPEHMDLNFMGARLDFHCKPVSDCIPIPEDATNGDVIKAMFPKSKTVQLTNMTIAVWYEVIGDCGKWVNYQIDWWNAKYKGVE